MRRRYVQNGVAGVRQRNQDRLVVVRAVGKPHDASLCTTRSCIAQRYDSVASSQGLDSVSKRFRNVTYRMFSACFSLMNPQEPSREPLMSLCVSARCYAPSPPQPSSSGMENRPNSRINSHTGTQFSLLIAQYIGK